MRTVLLILVPMALLAGVFYFALFRDRPPMIVSAAATQAAAHKAIPTTIPVLAAQPSVVGQSGGVFVESRNRSGRLTNDFRAQRFDPRKDGDVDVIFPEAHFYGENGSVVTLEGSGGRVALSQPGDRSDPQALGSATPTSGELKDVTVRFYERAGDTEPTIVAQVPAVHFDAVANRIATVDSLIDGKGVMAEQVPVTIRGRDFELDGQGLTMRWNDREGRLDQLEINHGDRLLVKDVGRFTPGTPLSRATTSGGVDIARSPATLALAVMGVVEAADAPPATTRPAGRRDLYQATFDRDVRVARDGAQLAAADVMRVILPLGDSKPDVTPAGTTRPATKQTTSDAGTSRPAKARTSASPATRPTTSPAGGPLEIRWTGKLTLRPAVLVQDAPREQMVELVGTPAWVSENGGRVEARLIHAEPDSGRLRIEPGGPVRSISVKDPGGAELRSRSPLVVDRQAGVAEVRGAGTLVTPPAQSSTGSTTVAWSRRLLLTLGDDASQSLKSIAIDGDANVASDALKLSCDALLLKFDPSTTPPATTAKANQFSLPTPDVSLLRVVDATGTATMDVGVAETARHLAADHIELSLVATNAVAGQPKAAAVTQIECDGSVVLTDAKGLDLTCATLDVGTKPIALGSSGVADDAPLDAITSLLATGSVNLKQADGSRANGERVEMIPGPLDANGVPAKHMLLLGTPASVAGARGALEGTRIELDPQSGNVNVPGPGKFVGADAKQPASAMAIAWADSMNADGTTGICKLNGGVNIDGTNADGTQLLATARQGVIEFTTRRAQPSTASTARPTTTPALAGVTLDSIRALHLSDDVDVTMTAPAVRTSNVQTSALDIDLQAGTVSAPHEGRMLMMDTRPRPSTAPATMPTTDPTTDPTTSPTIASADPHKPASLPTTRGSTAGKLGQGTLAVAWQDNLLWTLRDGTLAMNGAVRLGFERAGTNDPIRVNCDRIVCGLTPIQTGKGVDQMSQRVELRTVSAERNVAVRSKLASFDSTRLTFDALTNRATATGTDETPVDVYDADGTSHVGFSAITWNLETGMIEDFRDIAGRIRR